MNFLVFDTETTDRDPARARMVQLAWALFDDKEQELAQQVTLIKPEGFEIPESVVAIHGITNERATAEGLPLIIALADFLTVLDSVDILVAHNISYDRQVLESELKRSKAAGYLDLACINEQKFRELKGICTMKRTTDYCKIPGPYGYKWPRLDELHTTLFAKTFDGAHDAMNDVRACARCFFELKRKGVIKIK